jgi:hypothetical protein
LVIFREFIEPFCSRGVSKSKIKEIIFSPPLKRFGGSIEGIGAAAGFYGFSTRRTVNLQLKTLVVFRKFMEPFCSNGVDKNRKNSEFSPPLEVLKRQHRGVLALPLIFL